MGAPSSSIFTESFQQHTEVSNTLPASTKQRILHFF